MDQDQQPNNYPVPDQFVKGNPLNLPKETRKTSSLPEDEEQIKNLSVAQIKQIISYVRAMEQSSLDLSEQMSSILQ